MPLNHATKSADLTSQQFELIGRLVIEWSNIEFLLGLLLSRLLSTPAFLGRVYTDELNASRLQSALTKALSIHKHRYHNRILSPGDMQEILALNAEIEQIRRMRNKFSHFCWCRSTDQKIFGAGLSSSLPNASRTSNDSLVLSVKEIEALYGKAHSLVARLWRVIKQLPEIDEKKSLTRQSTTRKRIARGGSHRAATGSLFSHAGRN